MSQFIEITKKWYVNCSQVADVWVSDDQKDGKWHFYISYTIPNRSNDTLTCGTEEDAKKFLKEVVDRLNGKITQTITEDEE